jgi:CheY-like chemotaxis protein
MKIIVIDDTLVHRMAAQQTLDGHDLTVASSYDEAVKLLDRERYEVVLTDLLMPAGRDAQGPRGAPFVGQLMPVGFALALHAVLRGAKYVAVVSATNHHDHPASAMLDRLGDAYWRDEQTRPRFVINGATVGFFHHPAVMVEGQGKGKDWGKVLRALLVAKFAAEAVGFERHEQP